MWCKDPFAPPAPEEDTSPAVQSRARLYAGHPKIEAGKIIGLEWNALRTCNGRAAACAEASGTQASELIGIGIYSKVLCAKKLSTQHHTIHKIKNSN